MKQALQRLFFLLFIGLFPVLVLAQNAVITGNVIDEKTSEPLPYVNIGIKDKSIGTFSDSNGAYRLELPRGDYDLVISYVGYEKMEKHIHIDGKKTHVVDFSLTAISKELSTVVISASKYAQKIQESVSSIEVLKPRILESSNIQSVDKALEHMPGVTIVDNEPQIRAGSGFSSGLGSRVMVLVDEIPLLRGDAGRPEWGLMPVYGIDQIEVVKGASSVVYGSSALNGAINVRTAWPKDDAETKISTFLGIYSKPERKYATPWTGMNPLQYGLTVSHSQKLGNIDLIGNVSYFNDQGYIGATPESAITDPAQSTTGTYNRYIKGGFNTRVRSKNVPGLHYGINGNFMYTQNAQVYFWLNGDTNLYRPYPGAISNFKVFTFYVDPYVKYYGAKGSTHMLKNRVFYNNTDANNDQSNMSVTLYNEYQYQKKFTKLGDLILVAGIMNTYAYAFGKVFSGKLAPDSTTRLGENGTYWSDNLAVFGQLEKKFWKRLNVLFGFRYEFFHLEELTQSKPVFRAGLNYQAAKGTFLRASVGQGYRFPSIGERYITTNSGGFGFYPNPDLQPENSLSVEVGGKQMFRIGKFLAMADVALFYESYDNYVEFNFGIWGRSTDLSKNMGFKFFNTGPARIYGIDASVAGQGDIARNLNLSVVFGYTYSVPQALDTGFVFYQDRVFWLSYNTTSTDKSNNILKYRVQHLFKMDIDLTFHRWTGGISGRYYSFMQNIDKFFYDYDRPGFFYTGIKEYREENNQGTFIMDARLSYTLHSFRLSAIVNNLFNKEFSLRPCTIEPPRFTTLQVVYTI